MSLHEYHYSVMLEALYPPFYALIMAAMRKADTDNLNKLRYAFPEVWRELQQRYEAPAGIIPEDGVTDIDAAVEQVETFRRGKL